MLDRISFDLSVKSAHKYKFYLKTFPVFLLFDIQKKSRLSSRIYIVLSVFNKRC